MAAVSISTWIMNIFLAAGLKYLWNMVNLLQFAVFMRIWQVRIPSETDIFLKTLKTLALFEFLPTDQIDDKLIEWFGGDEASDCEETSSDSEECKNIEEESIFDQLAVVIIAAFVIFLLCFVLIILRLLLLVCPKVKRCFDGLKRKLFFGTFLRYLLLSTLKVQITFCSGLAIGNLFEATREKPAKDKTFVLVASVFMSVLSLAPIVIAIILFRKRRELKEPATRQSIGALYEHFNASKSYVGTYSVVFLVRRSLFVLTSFALYRLPGWQVQVMLMMTVAYLCYISRQEFYQSPFQKRVEMANECLLVLLCLHFILFTDVVIWEDSQGTMMSIGRSAIAIVVLLLCGNTSIIIAMNCKRIKLKIK